MLREIYHTHRDLVDIYIHSMIFACQRERDGKPIDGADIFVKE